MSFASSLLPFALFLVLQLLRSASCTSCIGAYDSNIDYFPHKINATSHGARFSIAYHNSYKIVRIASSGEIYVLRMCGAPSSAVPTNVSANATAIIEIPITRAAITSTTFIPFFEMLGQGASIAATTFDHLYVSSPCVRSRITSGAITAASNWSSIGADIAAANVSVTFGEEYTLTSVSVINGVHVPENYETSVLAKGAYILFFAAFFNAEAIAIPRYEATKDRYACVQRAAAQALQIGSSTRRFNVLYAHWIGEWNPGSELWSITSCPHYKCDIVSELRGTLLQPSSYGLATASGSPYYTTADFLKLAKLADLWIYDGSNYTVAAIAHPTIMEQIPAVASARVYDTSRIAHDWFSSRLAEPDVVLEDLLAAAIPEVQHNRVWLRRVVGVVEPTTVETVCMNMSIPSPVRADACPGALLSVLSMVPAKPTDHTTTVIAISVILTAVIIILVVTVSVLYLRSHRRGVVDTVVVKSAS